MNLSQIKKLLKYIFPAKLLEDEINLAESAQMSEADVFELVEQFHENSDKVRRTIGISKEKNKLIWSVGYFPVDENDFPCKGGHTIFRVSDKTGKIIEKIICPL